MSTPFFAVSETLSALYQSLRDATTDRKRRGLDFGKACYELKPQLLGHGWRSFLRENHISHKTADSWAKQWAKQQQLPWDKPQTGFWKRSYHCANALRPSISDGQEHKFITVLNAALSEGLGETREEQNYRRGCIKALKEIATLCADYAERLEKQEELVPTPSVLESRAP
jgi:hypothetical protein